MMNFESPCVLGGAGGQGGVGDGSGHGHQIIEGDQGFAEAASGNFYGPTHQQRYAVAAAIPGIGFLAPVDAVVGMAARFF